MASDEQIRVWEDNGLMCGFPRCCINHFILTATNKRMKVRDSKWDGTGYVPCPECAELPMLTIQGRINSNRYPEFPPFPSTDV